MSPEESVLHHEPQRATIESCYFSSEFNSYLSTVNTGGQYKRYCDGDRERNQLAQGAVRVFEAITKRIAPAFITELRQLNEGKRLFSTGVLSADDARILDLWKGARNNPFARREILAVWGDETKTKTPNVSQSYFEAIEQRERLLGEIRAIRERILPHLIEPISGRVLFLSARTGSFLADQFGTRVKSMVDQLNDGDVMDVKIKNSFNLEDLELLPSSGAETIVFTGHGSSKGNWKLSDENPIHSGDILGIEVQSAKRWSYLGHPYPVGGRSSEAGQMTGFQMDADEFGFMQSLSNEEVVKMNASHNARLVLFNSCFSARMAGDVLEANPHIQATVGVAGPMLIAFADDFNRIFMLSIKLTGIENAEMGFHLATESLKLLYKHRYPDYSERLPWIDQIDQLRFCRREKDPLPPFLGGPWRQKSILQ